MGVPVIRHRMAVVTVALALDAALGEPPNRWHPVAWFGRGAGAFERSAPHESPVGARISGIVLLGGALAGAVVAARAGQRVANRLPRPVSIVAEALLLKQAFAFRALRDHASAVGLPLEEGDVGLARNAVSQMVSRDVSELDEEHIASAAIESVAENLSDSVVAPIGWYLLGGQAAAYAYRVTNTLDAMVGYRAKGWFGTPSARLDDAMNLVPSRLTALLVAASSLAPTRSLRGTFEDYGRTPSPNSGWPMAAMAHGLGVRLEKTSHHLLNGGGQPPSAQDIGRANRVASGAIALGIAVAWLAALGGSRWRR